MRRLCWRQRNQRNEQVGKCGRAECWQLHCDFVQELDQEVLPHHTLDHKEGLRSRMRAVGEGAARELAVCV
eukprot:350941-Chlamydomonas_euryale.AAC.2